MSKVVRLFFCARGASPWAVLLCLFGAGFLEGIGIASLFPAFSVLLDGDAGTTSGVGEFFAEAFETVGLSLSLPTLLAFFLLANLGKSLLTLLAMRYVGHAGAEVAWHVRRDLVDALLAVRWRFLVVKPSGQLTNALGYQASMAKTTYLDAANFLSFSLQTLIYLAVAFAVSWQLALTALVVSSLLGLALHFLVRMAKRAGKRKNKEIAEVARRLADGLVHMKPLKAMRQEGALGRSLHRSIDHLRRAERTEVSSQELLRGLQETALVILICIGVLIAVEVVHYPIDELLVLTLVIVKAINAIGKMQRMYQKSLLSVAPYNSVMQLLNETRAEEEHWAGREPPVFEVALRLEDVVFSYDHRPILNKVDLTLPKGSFTILTGPSGAGKTTIVDLIAGLQVPQKGTCTIDGRPLGEIDLAEWRRSIGYVPQELLLFNDTLRANIALGDTRIDDDDILRALEQAGAGPMLADLPDGLDTQVGEKGGRLSGGQRQRVVLARALARRPRLLILDEVTSALDPTSERELCRRLRDLDDDITVLAITHRPQILELADQVLRLEHGQLERAVGEHALVPH